MTGKMPIVLPAWVAYTVLWLPKPYISVWTTHFHRVLHLWPHPPQIIGVKGVLSSEEATDRIYGGTSSKRSRLSYTPSGSLFSWPSESEIREGLKIHTRRPRTYKVTT